MRCGNGNIYNETYDQYGHTLYHKQGDYCVISNLNSVSHLEFRIHPDFVAYIENTNQIELRIITIPEGDRIVEKSLGKAVPDVSRSQNHAGFGKVLLKKRCLKVWLILMF